MQSVDVAIVGGGVAGLACALQLAERQVDFCLLEATDRCGGRVRTDTVDGFLLDHGFQVLLTAYPACRRLLDYAALDLHAFEAGAMVRCGQRFAVVGDPWRSPGRLWQTMTAPVGSLADKLRIQKLRKMACRGSLQQLYQRPQTSTLVRLRELGFSERMIDHFFRPWLGGIFLERQLATSSRMLEFVFRMFSLGDAALPAGGMQQIPLQMQSRLPRTTVRLNTTVQSVQGRTLHLSDGNTLSCRQLVLATEAPAAKRLLGERAGDLSPVLEIPFNRVTTLYYAADQAPFADRLLVLGGAEQGPINNLTVLSNVAAGYAPADKALVSVSVLGIDDSVDTLEAEVRKQLAQWFGRVANDWQFLQTYSIPYALPDQTPAALEDVVKPCQHSDLWLCGDYLQTRSLHGAMDSGLRAASGILQTLGLPPAGNDPVTS